MSGSGAHALCQQLLSLLNTLPQLSGILIPRLLRSPDLEPSGVTPATVTGTAAFTVTADTAAT